MATGFSAHARQSNLHQQQFDILVVGGGITGAGIARDAAMRGFKMALIDKGDFASGTSSKSSRLVHGGVRYLEMFEFGLVFEASRERRVLWNTIPNLARPLPFIFPVYRDARFPGWMINSGLWLYDALALFRNYRNHTWMSNDAVTRLARGFDVRNINGAAHYYDGQVDDARLTLETIRSAQRYGAAIANYVQVDSLIKDKSWVVGVNAHDTLLGDQIEIRARVVVNATGVWTDTLTQLDDPKSLKRMRPTKGAHILVPREKIGAASAVAFPNITDGRLLFSIPWGKFQIIGTTDTDYEDDYDHVFANQADVDYIIAVANHAFPTTPITHADVLSTYAGLRPLICQTGKNTSKTSREHEIWTTPSGLVSIAGGKLTTYRAMAEQLVNVVAKQLRERFDIVAKNPCMTAKTPIIEGDGEMVSDNLPQDVVDHLRQFHGAQYSQVEKLAQSDSNLAQRIADDLPYIWAEVLYAIENEMAMTVTDVLERRLHLLTESRDNGLAAAPQVARMLSEHYDWDKTRIDQELRIYQDHVDLTMAFRK
ncbi:MAG: glycerol-3-phosphate dehydrogenase/oxidase [Chloroflexi bacterium]|nr:glycerol-3-phosphate dehydrogenase/oxidase [Chloroflexota bacterium]